MAVTIENIWAEAEKLLQETPDGEPLDPPTRAMIALGVAASVTCLNRTAMTCAMSDALAAGVTVSQVQEVLELVSALGVHTLMLGAPLLLQHPAASEIAAQPLSEEQRDLWARYIGEDPYWDDFEAESPGFLDALLRLSPEGFAAFHDYCAIPWRKGTVKAQAKELIALACDATPTHCFLPGLRVHFRNALKLGTKRLAIMETLDIAAHAPDHCGVS